MQIIFHEKDLEDLYINGSCKKYKKLCRNKAFVKAYQKVITIMYNAENTKMLECFSFLHYEKLRNRPESSVRIMNSMIHRLLFLETDNGIVVKLLEIDDTHYGTAK